MEYSSRRVYTSSSPRPNIATSYSYTANPISRRRNKPVSITRVYRPIRAPIAVALGDQELLNLVTLGAGRAGSVPRLATQRLTSTPPPRSSTRLHQLYSELEDEVAANSQGLGALVPSYRRSLTPLRGTTPVRGFSPVRAITPGPIRTITYRGGSSERERESERRQSAQLESLQELQSQHLLRNRLDDVLLQLALGLHPPLYSLHHIPLRSASDLKEVCDIRRQYVHERNLYDPLSRTQSEIYRMAFNRAPRKTPAGYIAGNGTLACLTYAGGRPIPKRRRFYPGDENETNNNIIVTDGFNKFNNYYKPSAVGSYYSTSGRKPVYQPIYRSKKSLLGLPDTPRSYRKPTEIESKWESRTKGNRSPTPPPIRRQKPIISSPPPERRPQPPRPAVTSDTVKITLPRPRKSVAELELPSDFNAAPASPKSPTLQPPEAEASVVFKIPRRSISQEPPVVVPESDPEPQESAAPEPQEEVETFQVIRLPKKPSPKPAEVEPEVEAAPEPEPAREPTPPPPPAAEPEPEPEVPAAVEEAVPEPEAEQVSAPVESAASAGEESGAPPASASVAEDEETKVEEEATVTETEPATEPEVVPEAEPEVVPSEVAAEEVTPVQEEPSSEPASDDVPVPSEPEPEESSPEATVVEPAAEEAEALSVEATETEIAPESDEVPAEATQPEESQLPSEEPDSESVRQNVSEEAVAETGAEEAAVVAETEAEAVEE